MKLAVFGSLLKSLVPREKSFRPEAIGQYLEGHPSDPIWCVLQRPGPAFNLLVPVPQASSFPPSEPDPVGTAEGACAEDRETSDTEVT